MAQVRWTEESLRDVEAIYYFIARDSVTAAASLISGIASAVERLRDFPRSGRMVPDFERDDIREIILRGYRIVYRLRDDNVLIAAVHHGARRLDADRLETD